MFGGHMRGLTRERDKPTEVGKTLRRLMGYFRPFWGLLAIVVVLMFIGTAMRLASPYLTGVAVDQFIQPSDQPYPVWLAWLLPSDVKRTTGLIVTMALLVGSHLLRFAVTAGEYYLMLLAAQRVLFDIRTQIFERIQTLSLKFFDQQEAGDLMSRLVNDTQVISQVFGGGILRLTDTSLALVGFVIVMLSLNWRLALASFAIAARARPSVR
jgi:ABC-type multidrug transport system fused ATPase/permease subunit